jgi:phage shock protein PspC (stress-responsive transcriptional regulator)
MEKRLQRDKQNKKLAGVCSGLAEYFELDVTLVRVAFVFAVMAGLSGGLAYIILWIVMPVKPYFQSTTYASDRQYYTDYRV